jgi:Domain of unknown function (DUF4149)
MNALLRTASLFAFALWWGSLTTLGFIVVPMLFAHLDTAQTAGRMAARLFDMQAYVSLACGVVLLALHLCMPQAVLGRSDPTQPGLHHTGRSMLVWLLLALAASQLVQWVVSPRIVAQDNLKLWHALGSTLYIGQWVCVSALLFLRSR